MKKGCLRAIWFALLAAPLQPRLAYAKQLDFSPHVRSSDAWILQLLDEGRNRSFTLRGLLDHIEQSDGIVYVERGTCPVAPMHGCLLLWMEERANVRFLRIQIDARGISRDRMIAVVAHELQHAREVLDKSGVRTVRTMISLYLRIGSSLCCTVSYETEQAKTMADIVLRELAATPARSRVAERLA
jgi:hypothetical protein